MSMLNKSHVLGDASTHQVNLGGQPADTLPVDGARLGDPHIHANHLHLSPFSLSLPHVRIDVTPMHLCNR